MSSTQQTLDGATIRDPSDRTEPEDHLLAAGSAKRDNHEIRDLEREWVCDRYRRRITKSTTTGHEYGHGKDCKHRYRPGGDA